MEGEDDQQPRVDEQTMTIREGPGGRRLLRERAGDVPLAAAAVLGLEPQVAGLAQLCDVGAFSLRATKGTSGCGRRRPRGLCGRATRAQVADGLFSMDCSKIIFPLSKAFAYLHSCLACPLLRCFELRASDQRC
jgi:hypothetical protein